MKLISFFLFGFLLVAGSTMAQEQLYTCAMHPHYISTEMGTCPICGMDLVPVQGDDAMATPGSDPTGRAVVTIPPETIQSIGVRVESAADASFGTNVRSYGLVTENVRLTHVISGRVAGWIEDLHITAIGDEVEKDSLLFTLYSPDLISAQQDFIAAMAKGSKERVRSSEKRLQALGVSKKAIEQIRKSREKFEQLPFYADFNGTVSQLMVNQGSYISPGMQIATIQDYRTIWIDVNVAEKDMQFLDEESMATVSFPNLGNITRTARVDYIYPTIDENSRTGRVRLVLDNTDGKLRPGAYADVNFETNIEKRLSIPSEAILKSSEGDFVIVALGEGKFQPQAVQTGIHNKGRTEIVRGLMSGDKVVVSSQFMIDSESSLRETFRKLQTAQTPLSQIDLNSNQMAMMDHLIDAALYLHRSQVRGATPDANMITPALQINEFLLPPFRTTKLRPVLEEAETALMQARDGITDLQQQQAMAALVMALKPWITEGQPAYYKEKGIRLFLDHGTGQYWLQLGEALQHPYGGGHAVEVELASVTHDHQQMSTDLLGQHGGHH